MPLKHSVNELRFLLERLFEIRNTSARQNTLPKYIPTYQSPESLKTTKRVAGAAQVRYSCAAHAALVRHRCDAEQIFKTGQTSGTPNRGKCQVFIRINDSWKNLRVTPAVSAVNTDFANPQFETTATHLRRKCGPGAA